MNRVATALVHHPCVDKHGQIYTTSITNLDVHDIARSSRTYGVEAFYLVTPIEAQQQMARAITGYWHGEGGRRRNPTRTEAMDVVEVATTLEDAIAAEEAILGERPLILVTSARRGAREPITYAETRARMAERKGALILFGTGHGLAPSVIDLADHLVAPIPGRADYNHLSVRSAAAIILDRLLALDER